MSHRRNLVSLPILVVLILAACGPSGGAEPTTGPTPTPSALKAEATEVAPQPEAAQTEAVATESAEADTLVTTVPEPELAVTETVVTEVSETDRVDIEVGGPNSVETEANRDNVFTVRQGNRQALPAPQQTFLQVGDSVDVDQTGRAILRFGDLLAAELVRDGELVLQELSLEEQSAFVTVLQNGGALINDFNPQQEIERRFIVQTEFAVITATGTRFIVVREANSPLEWVVGLDAQEGDLEVTAEGTTKPVPTGTARWIAPIGVPSAGISADMGNVQGWIDSSRRGAPQPELGDVVWPLADILADTTALEELPPPGEPFELGSSDQGAVTLMLDPSAYSYDLQDCNGDGIRDIVIQSGKLHMDFRTVLARVRALDVTVINYDQPGGGSLRVLDPGRAEIASQPLGVGPGQGQILSMRSDQPYHYAELDMTNGCFLGFSLTPPTPAGAPGAPRPAVGNWQAAVTGAPTEIIERPPENGRLQAPPVGTDGYPVAIDIDGRLDDWDTLAGGSGVDWTAFDTVVYDPACANRYPGNEGAVDLSARVSFAYDDSYLYVAFLVDDDGYVGYSGDDQRFFLGDAPQLLLDMNLPGDFPESTLSQDDLQTDLYPGLKTSNGPYTGRANLWRPDTLSSREFSEARVAVSSTDTGYFVEAALPWASFGFTPLPGARLGLAASVSDNDTPGTDTQECMISTAPQRDWQNPTTWGTLLLSPAL
jgi:hypothetical protein